MNKINIIRVITLVLITMSNLAIGSDSSIGSDRGIGNGSASYEYEHLLTYLIFDLVVLGVLFVIYRVFYKLKMKT
ncbi:hypothetical protein [Psychrosphaera saromensis]|nr:hypothetical protein [Psychrosphaera saromensis]